MNRQTDATTAIPARPTITLKGARVRLPEVFVVWGMATRCKRPSRRYDNERTALAEAQRLADRHPGESFHVYKLALVGRRGAE